MAASHSLNCCGRMRSRLGCFGKGGGSRSAGINLSEGVLGGMVVSIAGDLRKQTGASA
jgi:hypothetical protein